MARSHNLDEFEKALRHLQIPMFNVIYAGRDGHILYLFNGLVPARTQGDSRFWSGVVPGDTSKTLWNGTLPYDALPKVIDPRSGWVQNTNDPPWSSVMIVRATQLSSSRTGTIQRRHLAAAGFYFSRGLSFGSIDQVLL